jgi:hypothetical protein
MSFTCIQGKPSLASIYRHRYRILGPLQSLVSKTRLQTSLHPPLTSSENALLLLADGTLGGTVFARHNSGFVSVEWLSAYLVSTDNNFFMTDVRALAMNGKERILRIFSANHTYHDPTWLQFGEKKSAHLYLSQRATVADESWLKISSYITNLLIGTINQRLNVLACGRYQQLDPVIYDVGVVTLGNPSVSGSIGPHADGKHGLLCASTPGYGRFQMNLSLISLTYSL